MADYLGDERRANALTDDQLGDIAARAGREAAKEVMAQHWQMIGYDISAPADVQRAQGDFQYLRGSHKRFAHVTSWVGRSVVLGLTSVVFGIIYLGWQAFTGADHSPGGGGPFN